MPPVTTDPLVAAAQAVQYVHTWIQVVFALVVIIAGAGGWAFVIWVRRKASENKKLIEANKKIEDGRIEKTAMYRDQQNKDTNSRIDDVAKKLDDHISADRASEEKMERNIEKINDRQDKMNEMMRDMKEGMVMKQEFSIFAQKMREDFSGVNARVGDTREMVIEVLATLKERARHEHHE